jgi:hypothetical protein
LYDEDELDEDDLDDDDLDDDEDLDDDDRDADDDLDPVGLAPSWTAHGAEDAGFAPSPSPEPARRVEPILMPGDRQMPERAGTAGPSHELADPDPVGAARLSARRRRRSPLARALQGNGEKA